jgi:hypothetical protein
VFESKYEKASFRKIKCVWVFYELLILLKEKKDLSDPLEKKDLSYPLDLFEEKIKHLKTALANCREKETPPNVEKILGVTKMEYLAKLDPPTLGLGEKLRLGGKLIRLGRKTRKTEKKIRHVSI